jgi:hypothetical protein
MHHIFSEKMNMLKLITIASVAIAVVSQTASAAVIYLREQNSPFGSNAVTTTPFDDAGISVTSGTGATTNTGAASNISLRTTAGGITDRALFATKNLFTLLPKTSGGDTINVTSAKLHLYANNSNGNTFPGDANATLTVYRVTSDWLTSAAGSSEANTSGRYRVMSSTTNWASGNGFGASDFTTAGGTTIAYNNAHNGVTSLDITSIVQAMYSTETNFGVVVGTSSASTISIRSSEQTANITPVFEIQYEYVPEPTSLAVMGLAGMLGLRRRR